MIKRELKTDEQLYIDMVSDNPDWLETEPLNKENLERYKKTFAFQAAKLVDCFGVIWHELKDSPSFKALEKWNNE